MRAKRVREPSTGRRPSYQLRTKQGQTKCLTLPLVESIDQSADNVERENIFDFELGNAKFQPSLNVNSASSAQQSGQNDNLRGRGKGKLTKDKNKNQKEKRTQRSAKREKQI